MCACVFLEGVCGFACACVGDVHVDVPGDENVDVRGCALFLPLITLSLLHSVVNSVVLRVAQSHGHTCLVLCVRGRVGGCAPHLSAEGCVGNVGRGF